jgi:predicted trehalose synthase
LSNYSVKVVYMRSCSYETSVVVQADSEDEAKEIVDQNIDEYIDYAKEHHMESYCICGGIECADIMEISETKEDAFNIREVEE